MAELRDGEWMITFDDGGASALLAGEELARRSWRGHFFIATDLIGRPGYLDWDGVRAVAEMGHVIGSHSCSHPDRMAACTWDQLMDEWSGSAAILAEELGTAGGDGQACRAGSTRGAWAEPPRRPGSPPCSRRCRASDCGRSRAAA